MTTDYWLSFLTGLAGSLHCVGMCGAIVVAYSAQHMKGNGEPRHRLLPHLTYNAGRVLSITILGALFGLFGGGIGNLRGVGEWFSLGAGILLVALGLALLRIVPWFEPFAELKLAEETRNVLFRSYRAMFRNLVVSPRLESKFTIGFLTPLLPCGLLYSMFVKAASGGDALSGAAIMFFFGLGIVPSLVLTGLLSSMLSERVRRWGDRIAAATILVMGVMLIARGLMGSGHLH